MTIQDLTALYIIGSLQARLNRSYAGIHKLRRQGRLPRGQYADTHGCPLYWPIAEIEALIAADPSLVLPAAKEDGQ